MAKTSNTNQLALLGGEPVGKIITPQFPLFTPRAIARVTELLQKGRTVGLSRGMPEIAECEDALSKYHDGRTILGASSGHAALHMAVAGLDIGPGDEVITTPYTWGASIACILHQTAIPIFADVDPITGLLDPDKIEAMITPRTKAILVVHIYGQPADMTRIMAVAKKHNLKVIEDGSQAHGATWKGTVVGNFGDAAGFSCMGGKLLATTEAGYMVTNHREAYLRACLIGQHTGRTWEEKNAEHLRPYIDSLVYTYRLSPINAVLLTEQIKKLDKEVDGRRANVDRLRKNLAGSKFISFPDYGKDSRPAYHIVTMNFNAEEAGVSRDTFQNALAKEGMPIWHYVPAPITQWKRLQWRNYKGPKPMWLDALKRAGVDYAKTPVPNCQWKVDHALEMGFNFYKPAEKMMRLMGQMVEKVESNIGALRQWEKEQKAQASRKTA